VSKYGSTICTEQDTRIKVIDRMFIEVLGWTYEKIAAEESSGGGFLDYKFSISGLARLIVEAKRDGRELGVAKRPSGRAFKLQGPVFNSKAAKEGIKQAIRYCGHKNAELACVTNGREWIVFRGSRLGDGKDTMEGMAFVFPSLESVKEQFQKFYGLLSSESIASVSYRAYFQEAEGQPIRLTAFRKSIREPGSAGLIAHSKLGRDIDRVMTSFFRRITGDNDPDMLSHCFVESRESEEWDRRLVRISEDIVGRVKGIDTDNADELSRVIERVRCTQRNEFVIIVGTKGAGKTTFIERFFKLVLSKDILRECVLIRINLADSDGDENGINSWLNQHFLEIAEEAVFGNIPPSFREIQGMFYDEYTRMRDGTLNHLYEKNKTEFKILFGKHIESIRSGRPHDYICRLIRHIAASRRKVPCIIFDNADHFTIDFQERVFRFARSIYENEICLIILPITDTTSWQLSPQGPLQSFPSKVMYLPTPSTKKILKKRIAFIERRIASAKTESGKGYFFGRGIELSVENLQGFVSTLNEVFINTGLVAKWIDNLANRDIRRVLELTREVATSPYLNVYEFLKAYIAQSTVPVSRYSLLKAVVRGKYDIYRVNGNKYVQNIYALNNDHSTSPLLGLRILQLLRDARRFGNSDSFITVNQVVDYFRAMTIDPTIVLAWLCNVLSNGLCLSYDPTVKEISKAKRIGLSPSGHQHLLWGTKDRTYLSCMIPVTPIQNESDYQKLEVSFKSKLWDEQRIQFVEYLVGHDQMYCQIPEHDAYDGQKKVLREVSALGKEPDYRNTLFRK